MSTEINDHIYYWTSEVFKLAGISQAINPSCYGWCLTPSLHQPQGEQSRLRGY